MKIGELALNYKLFKNVSEANEELIYESEKATDKQDRLVCLYRHLSLIPIDFYNVYISSSLY